MSKREKKYILSDGSFTTISEVIERSGLRSTASARYRLRNHTDIEKVFENKGTIRNPNNKNAEERIYTLDNGDKVTVKQVMAMNNITDACARSRLHSTTDPSRIYAYSQQRLFHDQNRHDIAMDKLVKSQETVKVVWGIPYNTNKRKAPKKTLDQPIDICRNQWLLDKDQYGMMNNGDD